MKTIALLTEEIKRFMEGSLLDITFIDILVDVQNAARGFVDRFLSPNEVGLLVPSIMEAGSVSNARPEEGRLCFSFRIYISDKRLAEFRKAFLPKMEAAISSCKDAEIAFLNIKRVSLRL